MRDIIVLMDDTFYNKQMSHVYAEEVFDENGFITMYALGGFVPEDTYNYKTTREEVEEFLKRSPRYHGKTGELPANSDHAEVAKKENLYRMTLVRKSQDFIRALRETNCNVSKASRISGLRPSEADSLRARCEYFAQAWEDAYNEVTDKLEEAGLRRAIDGVEEEIYWKGIRVGSKRSYSDTILNMMLQGRRSNVYKNRTAAELSGPNGGPIETADLSWAKDKLKAMMEKRSAGNDS